MRHKIGFVIFVLAIVVGLFLLVTGRLNAHESTRILPDGSFMALHYWHDDITIPGLGWTFALSRRPFEPNWLLIAPLVACGLLGFIMFVIPRRSPATDFSLTQAHD